MKKILRKTKKVLRKIKKLIKKLNKSNFAKWKYINYYYNLKIDNCVILLESQQGREVNGNIYYILKELSTNEEYISFKLYLTVLKENKEKIKKFLYYKGIKNVNFVELNTKEYFKIISKAKYLINDNTFLPFFIKKEGQIYLNTWHGTPLKSLGKKIKNDMHNIGNTQKNFLMSDYLLYPNEYTKNHMIEDYMIKNLRCDINIMMSGYPRNSVFFDDEQRISIRKELNLEGKQIIAYMPTWRGTVQNQKNSAQDINHILQKLDKKLKSNQILYVNLHPIEKSKVNYNKFRKIKPFPDNYETYEFLNVADLLITDYSSVFFDFANTNRKIILFPYDKNEYLNDRGLYMMLEELPFSIVYNINDLMNEINSNDNYNYDNFKKTFCNYDNINVTKQICETIILNKETNVKIDKLKSNKKENVLIYPGNLAPNGVTASLKNLLFSVDRTKRNYYLLLDSKSVQRYQNELYELSKYVDYITIKGQMNLNLFNKIINFFYRHKLIDTFIFTKIFRKNFKTEIKRILGESKFDTVIQFSGYAYKKILLFSYFDCNRVIYVHSNMKKEIETRKNQRKDVLKYAYNNYDKIAIVTEDLLDSTKYFIKRKNENKILVVNNLINYDIINKKKNLPVKIENSTTMNISFAKLNKILNSQSKKFINVGRFSPEKGQFRLIKCFERLWKEDNSIYLIIIGGRGELYEQIVDYVSKLECKNNIVTINNVKNPYAIMSKCDYFVLSSFYEGFGLVLAEANICGLPIISTDIDGPKKFMEKYNGTLVENSNDGIYEGMKQLLADKIKIIDVDYKKYNKQALNQFENLLKKEGK